MTTVRGWKLSSLLLTVLVTALFALGARWATERLALRAAASEGAAVTPPAASTDRLLVPLESRVQARPEDPRGYSLLGNAYLQQVRETGDPGYYSRAEAALGLALARDPQEYSALVGMGSLALSRHQFHEALAWGERASGVNPYGAQGYGVLGDAFVELGRYEEAWSSFQRMVDLRPDLSSYSRVAYARELNGDVSGAIEAMWRALAAGGPNAENTNWARVQLGHLYFNSGDLAQAEAQYRAALAIFPGYLHAQAGQARVLAARGDYAGAAALYQQAIERVPLPEYVIALSDLHASAGRSVEAARLQALVRAQQQLYRANGVNTDLEMALFDADHDQNLDSTVARARQEYAARPSIWAADVLAWTLFKQGEYQEALGYSRTALRLGTKSALLLFHAGMISYGLGDRREARALLEEALALNPHFSVLHRETAVRTLRELQGGTTAEAGE